jgi:hypothetical protein
VVDATAVVAAIHQNHDYGKLGTKEDVWDSVEARYNRSLMPGGTFTLDDATHALLPGAPSGAGRVPGASSGAGQATGSLRLVWRLAGTPLRKRLTALFSSTRLPVETFFRFMEAMRPLRAGLGLTLQDRADVRSPRSESVREGPEER